MHTTLPIDDSNTTLPIDDSNNLLLLNKQSKSTNT